MNTGTTFVGNIIALTSISVLDSTSIDGRALARNGSVTLINDKIGPVSCEGVARTATPTAAGVATSTPGPTHTPAPTHTALPTATATLAPCDCDALVAGFLSAETQNGTLDRAEAEHLLQGFTQYLQDHPCKDAGATQ